MIEISNLVKRYGDKKAVNGISFTVNDDEVLGFLGPNGAGKTTTMNIITGYLSSTSGTVKVNGHDILEEPELAKKEIGYLPENPPLYTDMTVKEYLNFICDLKGVAKEVRKNQLENIVAMVKISDVYDRLIGNLSKGYKQRVGIAHALVGNPSILILDEPTVGLDPNQILEIRRLIKALSSTHSVIISSHILSEIQEIADREGWTVLDKQTGDFTEAGGQEVMESYCKSYAGKFNVVVCENDNEAFGAMTAMDNAGVTYGPGNDVILISYDACTAGLEDVKAGKITADFECNPLAAPTVEEVVKTLESGGTPEKQILVPDNWYALKDQIVDFSIDGNPQTMIEVTDDVIAAQY